MAFSHTTVLTRKGQTTVPAELREKLGIREGDRLVWWEEDGQVIMISARDYAKRMSAHFASQADRSRPSLTIDEIKEAAREGWLQRDRKWREQQ